MMSLFSLSDSKIELCNVFLTQPLSSLSSLLSPPPQGRRGAGGLGRRPPGPLLGLGGPVVSGGGSVGPGSAGLGGAAGLHAVETRPHAESRPRASHAAPDAGPQQQDSDGAVAESSAPGAGDGGHLQRVHPVSALNFLTESQHDCSTVSESSC